MEAKLPKHKGSHIAITYPNYNNGYMEAKLPKHKRGHIDFTYHSIITAI